MAPDVVKKRYSLARMPNIKNWKLPKRFMLEMIETIQRLTEDCKRAKKDLRSHQRQEKAKKRNKTFQDTMDANSCDQKLFYKIKLINKQRTSKSVLGNILVDGKLVTVKTVKWEMLGKTTLNTLELQKLTPILTNSIWTQLLRMSEELNVFSPKLHTNQLPKYEVSAAIQRLNIGTAADGKGIMAEHIKKAGQDILRPLAHLFDLIFAEKKCQMTSRKEWQFQF